MKKKDEIILEIADVNFPNKAYGYYEGEKVIVKNAVPGQKVQAQVFKKRGSGVEARLQEVIERSPLERETEMWAAGWRRGCRRSSNALGWIEIQDCVPIMHFGAAVPIRPCGMRRSSDSRSDR